ncbi:MAG: hypothetical protein AAFX50_08245, partial [Acidobacteriota bacterium]
MPSPMRPHPRLTRALLLIFAVLSAPPEARAQDLIFSDGFESGDTSAWAAAVGLAAAPDCVTGPSPDGELDGDLGPAPGGGVDIACLTARNDRPFDRRVETAYSGVPIPRDLALRTADLPRLVAVGPGNRRLPAQF